MLFKKFQMSLIVNKQTNKQTNWVDEGSEFYNRSKNNGYKIKIKKCIQRIMKENLMLLKDLSEP